jgi:hypothetical protein
MYADTCRMTWLDVSFEREIGQRYNFRLFIYHKYQNLIKSKTDGTKNKGHKAQGANMYLIPKKILLKSLPNTPDTIAIQRTKCHLSKKKKRTKE